MIRFACNRRKGPSNLKAIGKERDFISKCKVFMSAMTPNSSVSRMTEGGTCAVERLAMKRTKRKEI
jgi:hypothetical protein